MKRKSIKKTDRKMLSRLDSAEFVVCKICGRKFSKVEFLAGHIVAKHGLDFKDYIFKYLENGNPNFKIEKCGFCHRDAKPNIAVNYETGQYFQNYDNGFMCQDVDCIDNICIEFFGVPRKECGRKFEHIGSKVSYLARKYKITKDEAIKRNMKGPMAAGKCSLKPESTCSLYGYISRYGKERGKSLYEERNKKISDASKIEWFIKKYGIVEGERRYSEKMRRLQIKTENISRSKNQYLIFESLKKIDNNWQDERFSNGCIVDMLNLNDKIAIEYFGDYWHANPKLYSDDYFNKSIGMTANDIRKRNKCRIAKILNDDRIEIVVVVWENSFLESNLNSILGKIQDIILNHKKGSKEQVWI